MCCDAVSPCAFSRQAQMYISEVLMSNYFDFGTPAGNIEEMNPTWMCHRLGLSPGMHCLQLIGGLVDCPAVRTCGDMGFL